MKCFLVLTSFKVQLIQFEFYFIFRSKVAESAKPVWSVRLRLPSIPATLTSW